MHEPCDQAAALKLFGVEGATASLIRHNENAIYDVRAQDARYALRIHAPAPGFDALALCGAGSLERRRAETEMLCFLHESGLRVQKPVAGLNGETVQLLPEGTAASLLCWLAGESYDAIWGDGDIPSDAAYAAGFAAGKLDALMRAQTPRFIPRRPYYGGEALTLVGQRLREALDAGVLEKERFEDMLAALEVMDGRIAQAEAEDGLTVCHADISSGNLIWDGKQAALIDFSLAGVASPHLDLAFLYANFTREGVRGEMRAGWEDGYGKRAQLWLAEPYYALGILLFIALRYQAAKNWDWFAGAQDRWCREVFRPLARGEAFLK